jgi:hypothetical protein
MIYVLFPRQTVTTTSILISLFFFVFVIVGHNRGGSVTVLASSMANDKQQVDLEARLQHHFSKYAMARQTLYRYLARNETFLSKQEWDILLKPDEGLEISSDPLALQQLKCVHDDIISQAEIKARKISKSFMNLDEIRLDRDEVHSFCNRFPRSAILNVGFLLRSAEEKDTINHLLEYFDPPIDANKNTMELLQAGSSSVPYTNNDLFQESFSHLGTNRTYQSLNTTEKGLIVNGIFSQSTSTRSQTLVTILSHSKNYNGLDHQEIVYKDFFLKCKMLGISYIEFVEPLVNNLQVSSAEAQKKLQEYYSEKVSSIYSITSKIQANFGITLSDTLLDTTYVGWFQTSNNLSDAENLVGIDIVFLPDHRDDNTTFDTLQRVVFSHLHDHHDDHRHGYPFRNVGVQLGNIRDSIVIGVNRIGIRVNEIRPDVLDDLSIILEYARRENVSFVILDNVVGPYNNTNDEEHSTSREDLLDVAVNQNTYVSFLKLVRLGFATAMATTNGDTNFTQDCFALVTNTNIQYTELKDLSYNTIRGSFASGTLKDQLMAELDEKFQRFESSTDKGHNLNSWDIIGIVLGCIFAVVLFVLVFIQITCGVGTTLMFRRRPPLMYVRRRLKEEHGHSTDNTQQCV